MIYGSVSERSGLPATQLK